MLCTGETPRNKIYQIASKLILDVPISFHFSDIKGSRVSHTLPLYVMVGVNNVFCDFYN